MVRCLETAVLYILCNVLVVDHGRLSLVLVTTSQMVVEVVVTLFYVSHNQRMVDYGRRVYKGI